MITKESGLSDIGIKASYWRKVDNAEALSSGFDLNGLNTLLIGRQGIHDEVTQEDEGFELKRRDLAKHYALALAAGEVEVIPTAAEILNELEVEHYGDDVGDI